MPNSHFASKEVSGVPVIMRFDIMVVTLWCSIFLSLTVIPASMAQEFAATFTDNTSLGLLEDDDETPIHTNTIQRFVQTTTSQKTSGGSDETRSLKKVFLSNRSVTCNDGSQAGFYLRKSHTSKKWIIFLEGGWYCYDQLSCQNRWQRQRHYMTSSLWPETKDVGGILSPNEDENPYWWNANHVFVPYCTSDSWSGSKAIKDGMFNFMGASIVQQVVRDLVLLGLENSTDVLLSGSSAGGTGVMLNLDPVQELLHDMLELPHVTVRGVTDSGWFLDRTPYAPSTSKPAVEAIRKGMQLWQGKVPRRCRLMYQTEPWRCYFGYRLYPTLKAPLFVFQWLFDEAQMDADNVGTPVTKSQWDYIHKMGDALRHSFQNVSAVFAPSCISHSILTKRDWQLVTIDDVSITDAIHCWEQHTIPSQQERSPLVKRTKKTATNLTMLPNTPNIGKRMANVEDPMNMSDNGTTIEIGEWLQRGAIRGEHSGMLRRRGKHGGKGRGKKRERKNKRGKGRKLHPNNQTANRSHRQQFLLDNNNNRRIRRNRRKHLNNQNRRRGQNRNRNNRQHPTYNTLPVQGDLSPSIDQQHYAPLTPQRAQRSVLRTQNRRSHHTLRNRCAHRRLERCSWPQCNHSCPRLHNPITGAEMDFLELLKSFGLDMESVAHALGIDMATLTNMDHGELLKVLTQQVN